MANFLDKVDIKTALKDRVKLDLGCDHITTAGWMQYNVVYNKELVPKERIDVQMETLVRMLPLVRPTFGRANVNNRAFFVPYHDVMPGWNDFISDTSRVPYNTGGTMTNGIITSVPRLRNKDVVKFIINNGYASVYSGTSPTGYDFILLDSAGYTSGTSSARYTLTTLGRQFLKVLNSMGYEICWDTACTTIFSALPLLCWVKIYLDWYWPSQYTNATTYQSLEKLTKIESTSGYYVTDSDLYTIFEGIWFVCYDSDYFTAAWDNPDSPNTGNYSTITLNSVDSTRYSQNTNVSNNTSIVDYAAAIATDTVTNTAGSNVRVVKGPVTQYVITALKSLTDYLKRHQLAGSRVIDRYLARFGVKLEAEKLHRSVMCGAHKVPLQIGDIYNTSNTGTGDFVGKGIGYNSNTFDYETEEYGQFMIISTIVPSIGYYQGVDRNVLRTAKADFWTPEFDNLGVQPITANELFVSPNTGWPAGQAGMESQIFGFTPRYSEYKIGRDRLTGDFKQQSTGVGEDSWYLFRDMNAQYTYTTPQNQIVHNFTFCAGTMPNQYNRIFQNGVVSSVAPDMFRVIYHFEVGSYSPMKALYDTYEFDEGGKDVKLDVNGVKAN